MLATRDSRAHFLEESVMTHYLKLFKTRSFTVRFQSTLYLATDAVVLEYCLRFLLQYDLPSKFFSFHDHRRDVCGHQLVGERSVRLATIPERITSRLSHGPTKSLQRNRIVSFVCLSFTPSQITTSFKAITPNTGTGNAESGTRFKR